MGFEANYKVGSLAEDEISRYLQGLGGIVQPAYEIHIAHGKGPRLFSELQELVLPDMLVWGLKRLFFAECKSKSVFTWYRRTQCWQTGVDLRHYRDYVKVVAATKTEVWLFFLHKSRQPHERDLRQGSPGECPTGLFVLKIGTPLDHIDVESGMIYWRHTQLHPLET